VGSFAEGWNGTSWSLQAVPPAAGDQFDQLYSVSCADSACEATGLYFNSSGTAEPLAERWDGTTWHAQAARNPAGLSFNALGAVSCPSSSDCIAAGIGNGNGTPVALAEEWQAGGWRIERVPNPIGAAENQLNGIACPGVHRCVAVGTVGPTRGVMSPEALAWNGRTWHLQRMAAVPGTFLNAVSCASTTDCVAVGSSNAGTLAERWIGHRWALQRTRNPAGSQGSSLNAVSCTSASNCMAVGGYGDAQGRQHVLAERWNGHHWRLVPAPSSSAPNSFLVGIACTAPSACIAVGGSFDAQFNSTGSLTERWNGSQWRRQHTSTAHTLGDFLAGVWCKSASACIAVGNRANGTLAERLDHGTWRVQRTPNPPGTAGDFFNSVSCTSLSACTGVGMAFAPGGFPPQTLAERWNGAHWRLQRTPLLPGITDLSNFSVACPARSLCIAAGGFENDGPGAKSLTEVWRGSGTSSAVSPDSTSSSPYMYHGMLGCLRAVIGQGFGNGVSARIGPTTSAPLPQRTQIPAMIHRISSLCSAA